MAQNQPTRKIWTYWHQGWGSAPPIVKQCGRSWIQYNPEYEAHFLDSKTISAYIDIPAAFSLDRKDMTITKISNYIRLSLLNKYGGVWVDATLLCLKPLDDWIPECYDEKYFAFRSPDGSRLFASWFMAAEPGNRIIGELLENYTNVFSKNYYWNHNTRLGKPIKKFLTRRWRSDVRSTLNWHSWFVRKILGIYPYFILHYTFNKIILADEECARIWKNIPRISAKPRLKLQKMGRRSKNVEKAKSFIQSGDNQLCKLNWRLNSSNRFWSEILPYLESRAYQEKASRNHPGSPE